MLGKELVDGAYDFIVVQRIVDELSGIEDIEIGMQRCSLRNDLRIVEDLQRLYLNRPVDMDALHVLEIEIGKDDSNTLEKRIAQFVAVTF